MQPLQGEGCGRGRFRASGRGRDGQRKGAGPEVVPRGAAGLACEPGRAGPEKFSLRLLSEGAGPRRRCTPAAMAFRRRTKSYPLFSQEFIIHNHADIGFCLVLCVLIGLMFEVSRAGRGAAGVGGPNSRAPRRRWGFPDLIWAGARPAGTSRTLSAPLALCTVSTLAWT